jgi:hypothetical protein
MARKDRSPTRPATDAKPPARVYHEHVAILRELRAPEKVIQLAEKAAAANSSSSDKK